MLFLYLAILLCSCIPLIYLAKAKRADDKGLWFCICIWVNLIVMIVVGLLNSSRTPEFQYVPAEYIAENATSTYFGTQDGNIFYVDRMPLIDKNVPYLLGMDTKGTSDVTDDEILTVWRLCE